MGRFKGLLVGVSVLLTASFCVNMFQCSNAGKTITHQDTVRTTYIDTIPFLNPVPKDSTVIRYVTVTLPVTCGKDTIYEEKGGNTGDSVNITLPITSKVYGDSTYTAYVSGFRANLDSIFVYPRHEVITTITDKTRHKRWGIGVQAGYGISRNSISPYIGIGISYNIISF